MEYRLLSPDGQIITRGLGGLQKKKKKRSTLHCCGEIPSAKPFEAHVARWCAEFHHFLRVGDCAGRCVYCAEGSKQLRGRARAQPRGNVAYALLMRSSQKKKTDYRKRCTVKHYINIHVDEKFCINTRERKTYEARQKRILRGTTFSPLMQNQRLKNGIPRSLARRFSDMGIIGTAAYLRRGEDKGQCPLVV